MISYYRTMAQWMMARVSRLRDDRGSASVENVLWIVGIAAVVVAVVAWITTYVMGKLAQLH